jgi:hypothetical protein
MKKHCVKNTQNLVGRLEAAWAMAWQGFGGLRGHGLLKSTVFANAVWLCEKPCFLLNQYFNNLVRIAQ